MTREIERGFRNEVIKLGERVRERYNLDSKDINSGATPLFDKIDKMIINKFFRILYCAIFIITIGCNNNQKSLNRELFGLSELSALKDNIEITSHNYDNSDSITTNINFISWKFFNKIGFEGLQVYSLDSSMCNLHFFAINKTDKNIAIFFEKDSFYVYELVKKTAMDSVNILIN